jgi:hypothetical protein
VTPKTEEITMALKPVKSSFLHSVDHDPDSKTLIVVFKKGDLYTYDGVSVELFAKMMAHERPSAVFIDEIRDCYPATKVPVPLS